MCKNLILKNCKFYDRQEETKQDILIKNGKIKKVGSFPATNASQTLDLDGKIIAPGFIDIHIHGAGGYDFGEGTKKALKNMSNTLAKYGVTSFLGTTLTKPPHNKHLKLLNKNIEIDYNGANILGAHLEGPFISPQKRGGIPEHSVSPFSRAALTDILDLIGNKIKMMTIAPEIERGDDLISELNTRNIIPSFGHSNASYRETKHAFQTGLNHVSHLFNAMPSLHHRDPGPLLSIFESNSTTVQLISDGVHLHPGIINFTYENLGPNRCICISDGIESLGLSDGRYQYYGREYIKKGGTAYYPDGTLIGSTLDLGSIVFRFKDYTDCTLEEAINTVTKNPARLLGIYNKKGSLEIGKDADITILNPGHSIFATIIDGQIVYKS